MAFDAALGAVLGAPYEEGVFFAREAMAAASEASRLAAESSARAPDNGNGVSYTATGVAIDTVL